MARGTIELVGGTVAVVLLLMSLEAWRGERKETSQLGNALEAQQKLITDANNRETERENTLKSSLSDIANLKRKTRTPSQLLRELPKYLPLPQPIVAKDAPTQTARKERPSRPWSLSTPSIGANVTASENLGTDAIPSANTSAQTKEQLSMELPAQDCRACNAKLSAAQRDATDDSLKLTALTKQRDLAVNSAKGGTLRQRLKSHLRWLAVGAGIGLLIGYRKG